MTTTREYVSVTETAKLIRADLHRLFPGVKFSVRSSKYAGGASIDVGWTDGPTEATVDEALRRYVGKRFTSMNTTSEYLADLEPDPIEGLREVHYGSDYVFTRREISAAFVATVLPMVRPIESAWWNDRYCRACGTRKGEIAYFVPTPETESRSIEGCSPECAAKIAAHHVPA